MLWMMVPTGITAIGIAWPGLMSTRCAGTTLSPTPQPLRRQDVGQLAVLVLHQRDERAAVRIVLEPLHRRRHVELAALEIDEAIRTACARRR